MSTAQRLAALIASHGEPIQLLRAGLPGVTVVAKLVEAAHGRPLAPGLRARGREAVVAAAALSAEGWPAPQRGDRLVFAGATALVEEVETRREAGVALLYRLTLSL